MASSAFSQLLPGRQGYSQDTRQLHHNQVRTGGRGAAFTSEGRHVPDGVGHGKLVNLEVGEKKNKQTWFNDEDHVSIVTIMRVPGRSKVRKSARMQNF